jgi:hypothetical protein
VRANARFLAELARTPKLPQRREALTSRIWECVYGLRAELITRESLRGDPDRVAEFEEVAAGSLWYLARLLTQIDRFMERYDGEMMAGSTARNAEGLIRLAGWSGEVTAEQARELRLRLARTGYWERRSFVHGFCRPAGYRASIRSACPNELPRTASLFMAARAPPSTSRESGGSPIGRNCDSPLPCAPALFHSKRSTLKV